MRGLPMWQVCVSFCERRILFMESIQQKVKAVPNQQPQAVSKAAYACYAASIISVLLSLVMWFVPATDEAKKARGERLAIFVGLWPPTLAIFGKVIEDRGRQGGTV
jgi:hypothetical protein